MARDALRSVESNAAEEEADGSDDKSAASNAARNNHDPSTGRRVLA